mgnify:FL=1
MMRLFLKIAMFLSMLAATAAAAQAKDAPTIREQMQIVHEHFGVNFIYDSSIDLETRSEIRINPSKMKRS